MEDKRGSVSTYILSQKDMDKMADDYQLALDEIKQISVQRDELAEALREMLAQFDGLHVMVHDERAACDRATAALAKLDGR